jgi:hypothetical protein
MNWLPGPETRAAVVRHPFFLAGLAVVALLGLTAAVLVVADSVKGDSGGAPTAVVEPALTTTPGPTQKTAVASGVVGTTKITTSVRSAPGDRTVALGTIASKVDVAIDGRTTDSKWFRIIYPPNSELHGWIDAEDLTITGDPTSLVVATAEPAPFVELPTAPPSRNTPVPVSATPDLTLTPVGTATPGGTGLPDLVISTPPNISGDKLFVTVVNQGAGVFRGNLVVAVFNADRTALVGGATLPNFTLQPGRSIDVGTGFVVGGSQTLVLVVDPNGEIEETDNTNNRVTVAVATGNPTPTPAAIGAPPETIATLIAIATSTAEAQAAATPAPPPVP